MTDPIPHLWVLAHDALRAPSGARFPLPATREKAVCFVTGWALADYDEGNVGACLATTLGVQRWGLTWTDAEPVRENTDA